MMASRSRRTSTPPSSSSGATKSSTTGLLKPNGALGQDPIIQVLALHTGDSKAILDSQQAMVSSQQALMDIFAMRRRCAA